MSNNVIDPVCGMTVKPESAHATDLDGIHYRFCSAKCKTKFDAEPAHYLASKPEELAVPGAEYTCPMHPEIRQTGPGTCPKCGMALQPSAAGQSEEGAELRDMSLRFIVATALGMPVAAHVLRTTPAIARAASTGGVGTGSKPV